MDPRDPASPIGPTCECGQFLNPADTPQKCDDPRCDNTGCDECLVACDGCGARFCQDCITVLDDLDLCRPCFRATIEERAAELAVPGQVPAGSDPVAAMAQAMDFAHERIGGAA